ncbi:MAG: sugar nucleotide-binding protein [Lachnospiraceae bacterium]|nr:sugar nucleotide-binding protein [Lachnospiraceae bacterium]
MSEGKKVIWIAGAKGSLGSQLNRMMDQERFEVLATDLEVDVTDLEAVSSFAEKHHPDVVVNSTRYNGETGSQQEIMEMYHANTLGARNLAVVSRKADAKIIQMSTDDVFSGDIAMELTEFDQTVPATDYGKSKLAAEKFVQSLNPKHFIIRSSWVYGKTGKNFLTYIMRMAKDTQILSVPNDQISAPTSAKELAKFIISLMETQEYGLFHASCEGSSSRYGFAQAILDYAGITSMQLVPVLTSNKEIKARYTVLKNLMMEMTGIYKMPDWRAALKECIEEDNISVEA